MSFVYFLRPVGGGPIKIGRSDSPELRLSQCNAWSPYPLELICAVPGDWRLERNIQDCFADCHFHHEWFHPEPRLLDAIRKIATGQPVNEAVDLADTRGNTLGIVQRATMSERRSISLRRAG